MSTATAHEPNLIVPLQGGKHHFLLRRLHSLTGLVFGGYLVVHLLVNATLIEGARHSGPTVFQIQVDKIHSLPFLLLVEFALIYIPILYHTIYGIWITFTGQANVGNYPYSRNVFYTLQRISAFIIFLFMVFHIFGMKGLFGSGLRFEPATYATESAAYHFQQHWSIPWIIYPIGVLASCYHLANGFWTAGITWGLTVSAEAQKRWGYVCAGLFLLTFICGMLALIAIIRMEPVLSTPWIIKAH